MSEVTNYDSAVETIKTAILQSQYDAARSVNEKQLMLYYGIGKYISANSREGHWGTGAIDTISERLQKEMPGLRGFSARNLKNMRLFYEEWEHAILPESNSNDKLKSPVITGDLENAITVNRQLQLPIYTEGFQKAFFSIGFTHHIMIITKAKDVDERIFYIKRSADEKYSVKG